MAVELGHFPPYQHQALAFAAMALIKNMIFNDFKFIEEAVMQAVERVGIIGDGVGQELCGARESHAARQVPAQAFGRLHCPDAAGEQKVLCHQEMQTGLLAAIAVKFLSEIIEMAYQVIALTCEVLPKSGASEFRGQNLRHGKTLREPAETAPVTQIEMQPDPAVARQSGSFKGCLRERKGNPVCTKAPGADEARYGWRRGAYRSTGSTHGLRRIWVSTPSIRSRQGLWQRDR